MSQLGLAFTGLLVSAWPVDRLVEKLVPNLPPRSLLRATDTAVHGLIGGFSYWMACTVCPALMLNTATLLPYFGVASENNKQRAVPEPSQLNIFISFCVAFFISCCVDLDHIIKEMFQDQHPSLWQRGLLHHSLPPLILTCVLYVTALLFRSLLFVIVASFCILSILSHHIRDGVHHGVEFYPLGTSPKLAYWVYLMITLILPLVTSQLASFALLHVKSPLLAHNEGLLITNI